MQPTGEATIQIKRRIIIGLIVVPMCFGFAAFTNMLGNPRFQEIRSVDALRLIAVGACGGVAVAGLAILISLHFRKS
jgi:hypothetical protein